MRFEQEVLDALERGHDSLDALLGLYPPRKIDVVVYDPDVFQQSFGGLFRFAAAGFYGGVIRVRGATEMTLPLSRVLHHELVHAALDMAAPSYVYPGWFNEGLAEWFEARAHGKRRLSAGERAALVTGRRTGALATFQQLSAPSFAALGPQPASYAYLQSYAMFEFLARNYGEGKLEQLVDEVLRSRNLDRSLRRVYRADLATLGSRFLAQFQ